jgi:hypothetical protein
LSCRPSPSSCRLLSSSCRVACRRRRAACHPAAPCHCRVARRRRRAAAEKIAFFRKSHFPSSPRLLSYILATSNYNNCSPAVGNDSQNSIHCCRWAAKIYELN